MPGNELRKNYLNVKARFVGYPLVASANLLKEPIANILGFQWLIPHISSENIPYIKISLPSFSYVVKDAMRLNRMDSYIADIYETEPLLVSGFFSAQQSYRLNPVNFLFVGMNYLARNLGKALGVALVSPYTIPAFLCIKSYFSLKIGIENITNYFSEKQENTSNNKQNDSENELNKKQQNSATQELDKDPGIYVDIFSKAPNKIEKTNNQEPSVTNNFS
jgi:hypothetical protein